MFASLHTCILANLQTYRHVCFSQLYVATNMDCSDMRLATITRMLATKGIKLLCALSPPETTMVIPPVAYTRMNLVTAHIEVSHGLPMDASHVAYLVELWL